MAETIVLTGNEVAEEPCPVVLANPGEEGEEVVHVTSNVSPSRRVLLRPFKDGRVILSIRVDIGDGRNRLLLTAGVNAQDLGHFQLLLGHVGYDEGDEGGERRGGM